MDYPQKYKFLLPFSNVGMYYVKEFSKFWGFRTQGCNS